MPLKMACIVGQINDYRRENFSIGSIVRSKLCMCVGE